MAHYHMRRKDREITDQQEIQTILMEGKYAVLALCRDNEPYIVTLSYGLDKGNNRLYFHAAKEGLKLDFIKANPLVCASVIRDKGYSEGQCSHSYITAVIRGKVVLVEELAEKKHGMAAIMHQLESAPGPIAERSLSNDKAYESFTVIRLDISSVTVKRGQ